MEQAYVYKNVEIPRKLMGIINHMTDVERYREELHNLGSQWDLLTILGQMNGTGTDMTGTRAGFSKLTSELLAQLGLETLKKTVQDMGARAQVAVDIVIRNLFERTADIGFLATDDDIRDFIKSYTACCTGSGAGQDEQTLVGQCLQQARNEGQAHLVKRFQEYVAKYSVYFNIILLDPAGNVLVQLDGNNAVTHSSDPLILEVSNSIEARRGNGQHCCLSGSLLRGGSPQQLGIPRVQE